MHFALALILAAWPQRDAALHPLELPAMTPAASAEKGTRASPKITLFKIAIDAGHGAPGNEGNHGCLCQLEQDHALAVANELATLLPTLGPFDVKLTRPGETRPSYADRIHVAEVWKADAIISIHSDARGFAWPWHPNDDALECWKNDTEPGFAVLWSDDAATKPQFARREALGRAVVEKMTETGFVAYSGVNYGSLYRPDVTTGGWIDIRVHGKNVYFLRASSTVPTVIIETHHALDPDEVKRWDEPETRRAFATAIAAALLSFENSPR